MWLAEEHQARVGFGKAPRAAQGTLGLAEQELLWGSSWSTESTAPWLVYFYCNFCIPTPGILPEMSSPVLLYLTCCLDLGVWVVLCEGSFLFWFFLRSLLTAVFQLFSAHSLVDLGLIFFIIGIPIVISLLVLPLCLRKVLEKQLAELRARVNTFLQTISYF